MASVGDGTNDLVDDGSEDASRKVDTDGCQPEGVAHLLGDEQPSNRCHRGEEENGYEKKRKIGLQLDEICSHERHRGKQGDAK